MSIMKEETAFDWFQRVQRNKKLELQNPIYFPNISSSSITFSSMSTSSDGNDNSITTPTETSSESIITTKNMNKAPSSSWKVSSQNIIRMNANCFFSRMYEYQLLRGKFVQWQMRMKRMNKRKLKMKILRMNKTKRNSTGRSNSKICSGSSSSSNNACTNDNDNHINYDDDEVLVWMEKLEKELINSCFVTGTGIKFIDQILQSINNANNNKNSDSNRNKNYNNVIEIIGKTGTGKSQILMSLAANYVACTTNIHNYMIMKTDDNNNENNNNHDPQSSTSTTSTISLASPFVIIIDPDHSINCLQLKEYVVSALLRRLNETDRFREYYLKVKNIENSGTNINNNNNTSYTNAFALEYDEYTLFDQQVLDALDRIHIIRPKDVSNGYVATLECLHQSIQNIYNLYNIKHATTDTTQNQSSFVLPSSSTAPSSPPPILLLMDSIFSAFDATDKMYENIGEGLSGKNDFIRQLKRLLHSFDIVLIATRTIRSSTISSSSSSNYDYYSKLSKCDGWNKMVSNNNRITIEKALSESKEEQDGYHFVAIMPVVHRLSSSESMMVGTTNNVGKEYKNIIPFSITNDGIKCK